MIRVLLALSFSIILRLTALSQAEPTDIRSFHFHRTGSTFLRGLQPLAGGDRHFDPPTRTPPPANPPPSVPRENEDVESEEREQMDQTPTSETGVDGDIEGNSTSPSDSLDLPPEIIDSIRGKSSTPTEESNNTLIAVVSALLGCAILTCLLILAVFIYIRRRAASNNLTDSVIQSHDYVEKRGKQNKAPAPESVVTFDDEEAMVPGPGHDSSYDMRTLDLTQNSSFEEWPVVGVTHADFSSADYYHTKTPQGQEFGNEVSKEQQLQQWHQLCGSIPDEDAPSSINGYNLDSDMEGSVYTGGELNSRADEGELSSYADENVSQGAQ